jgi:hypothetical protein
MAYTALELANLALTALGEPNLTGFDDSGHTASKVNQLFPMEFRALLKREGADWYWAVKVAELAEDESHTHYTGWDYAYDPPSDLLRPINIFDFESQPISWEFKDSHFLADYEPFTDADSNVFPRLWYIADALTDTVGDGSGYPALATGYGAKLPDEWANAFAARLAWKLSPSITKNEKKTDKLRQDYMFVALPEAERINAIMSPGYGPPEDGWEAVPTS